MFDFNLWLSALPVVGALAVIGWLVSLPLRNASIVDSLWSVMFVLCLGAYLVNVDEITTRGWLLLALVGAWAFRLSAYITWRNWGEGEDYRYQNIRANNSPNFAFKSLYIVFGLQAVLAWLISLPLLGAVASKAPLGLLDGVGATLFLFGLAWETVGDHQLARFKADPRNKGKVLDTGLWGLSRHPNYFGEAVLWWGVYLIAVSAGAWWSLFGPLLITFLLLRVSGVAMLEKDIGERRPAYARYIRETNAFIPGPRKALDIARGEVS
jgi:steroid 5-alpha reductase family enzyme